MVACDLDNTLIHSYKHRQEKDICIERIKGREQGFMAPKAVELLRCLKGLAQAVPVTARSLDQYLRIRWPLGCLPDYAVAANGGILLNHGEIDGSWREESQNIAAPFQGEINRLCRELAGQGQYARVQVVDGIYLFACAKEGGGQKGAARAGNGFRRPFAPDGGRFSGQTALEAVHSGRKSYFLPPGIHKGAALLRLKKRLGADFIICAGDSEPDIPMLKAADLAIVPSGRLAGLVGGGSVAVCGEGENFAEFVLETAIEAVRERRR